jgi:two-component system nitrogen regulation sensor histidine kinase GlnL
VRGLLIAEFGEGLRVERDYDPSLPSLLGDTDQLVQATLNIARNGAQAVAGNGTIRLRTRAARNVYDGERRHRLMLRVDVEDDGPGIPDALRDRLFLPLISGRAGGTGLGLAIAHEIVRRHGGHIEFSSRPGKTIFRLYLPAENGNE